MTDFDAAEVIELAADLGRVPGRAVENVGKALEVGARTIKDTWQENAAKLSGSHARAYPNSVDYSVAPNAPMGSLAYEIGPNPGRHLGNLGILEEARGGVQSRPQNAGRDALRTNEDDIVEQLGKAVEDIL
jgi:hypothetical protein